MRKIYYTLDIGYCGCGEEGIETVTDDMTNADIDQMVHDMAMEHAQGWEGDEHLCWNDEMSEEEWEHATAQFYDGVCGWWRWATDEDE